MCAYAIGIMCTQCKVCKLITKVGYELFCLISYAEFRASSAIIKREYQKLQATGILSLKQF